MGLKSQILSDGIFAAFSSRLQAEIDKKIRAQWINHFYQQAVDYNLDIGVLLFTLLA